MKMRAFNILTSFVLVVSLVSVFGLNSSAYYQTDEYEYCVLYDNTVEIVKYLGSASEVTIPSTIDGKKVVKIGDCAFEYCSTITSVKIPSSVTSIGNSAFSRCYYLTTVTIPNSITNIPDSTFSYCSKLANITIGNGVTSIGNNAFSGCSSLTNVVIPYGVTSIGTSAFSSCGRLLSVTIPNTVTSIETSAFSSCSSLVNITIPNTVTSIGEYVFSGCNSFRSVTIPEGVKTIGAGSFSGCKNLETVNISNSVTDVEYGAFSGCPCLTSITIGTGLKEIRDNIFYDCPRLAVFYYAGTEIQWNTIVKTNATDYYDYEGSTASVDYNYSTNTEIIKNSIVYYNHVHSYGSWTTKAATCSSDGIKTRKCKTCSVTETVTTAKAGHKYTTVSKDGYTINKCSVCGYEDYSGGYTTVSTGSTTSTEKPGATVVVHNPATVTGLKVSATTAQAIKLTCNKLSGATGYVFYRANAGKWVRIGVSKTNAFTDTKLKAGTSYRYAVKAYKTVGGKNYYSASLATLWASTNPATVNFTATAGSKKVALKWSKVNGATGYIAYMKTSAKGKWAKIATTKNLTYTKTGLTKGKTYWFTVKAYRTANGKTYNGAFVTKSVKVK